MTAGQNGSSNGGGRPLWVAGLSPPDSWRSLRQPGNPQLHQVRHPQHRVWGHESKPEVSNFRLAKVSNFRLGLTGLAASRQSRLWRKPLARGLSTSNRTTHPIQHDATRRQNTFRTGTCTIRRRLEPMHRSGSIYPSYSRLTRSHPRGSIGRRPRLRSWRADRLADREAFRQCPRAVVRRSPPKASNSPPFRQLRCPTARMGSTGIRPRRFRGYPRVDSERGKACSAVQGYEVNGQIGVSGYGGNPLRSSAAPSSPPE